MVLREIEGGDWNDLEAAFQERGAKPIGMANTVFIKSQYIREHKAAPYNKMGEKIDLMENNEFGGGYSTHTEAIDF